MEEQKQEMRAYVSSYQKEFEAIFARMLLVQPEDQDAFLVQSLRAVEQNGSLEGKYDGDDAEAGGQDAAAAADPAKTVDYAAQMREYIVSREPFLEEAFLELMTKRPENAFGFLASALESRIAARADE